MGVRSAPSEQRLSIIKDLQVPLPQALASQTAFMRGHAQVPATIAHETLSHLRF